MLTTQQRGKLPGLQRQSWLFSFDTHAIRVARIFFSFSVWAAHAVKQWQSDPCMKLIAR